MKAELELRVMETVAEAQWWFFWMGAVFGSFICFSLIMLLPWRKRAVPRGLGVPDVLAAAVSRTEAVLTSNPLKINPRAPMDSAPLAVRAPDAPAILS